MPNSFQKATRMVNEAILVVEDQSENRDFLMDFAEAEPIVEVINAPVPHRRPFSPA
jgi:hypothetical protein